MSIKSKLEKLPFYNELVRPWHLAQAVAAAEKYHFPAKKMRVIAVTGTNGKTTTSFMIWKMLNEAGHKTGLLTTVAWGGVGGSAEPVTKRASNTPDTTKLNIQYEHMTTERVEILNQRMRAIAEAGAEFLVLETTSHALSQFRTFGVPVEIAVFTNITHEHLDYHKTFANYRKAKRKLFQQSRYGVVNADDPNAHYFTEVYASSDISTYGIEQGDYRAKEIELKSTGVEYVCGDIRIQTQIPGKFNVYNSLAALAVGKRLGLTDEQISRGIAALESVEGRMNRINCGQDFEVIVDYAHTPDALEKVFESVKDHAGRIISLHGGAGRRDESTRFLRGEILGKYSDIVIITEDDSRDEDPAKIAEQFVKGAEKAGKVLNKNLYLELDRRKAIEKALGLAKKGDLVLLLGKGHEKTILRADGPQEFEDIKVAKEILDHSAEEMLDVLDEHGEKTGRVASRAEVHARGYWHRVVCVAVIDEQNRILLQQRSKNSSTNPGKWDISAAGHVGAGEDALASAVRETAEEVGIKAKAKDFQYIMSYQKESHPLCRGVEIIDKQVFDVFLLKVPAAIAKHVKLQKSEVQAARFCSLDEFRKMIADGVMMNRQPVYDFLIRLMEQG